MGQGMKKLDNFLGSNVGQLAEGAVAQGISMIGQKKRSEEAHERNLQYMDIQNQNQQGLNAQQYQNQRGLNQMGHDLQYDMWNKTNYAAQVEHMKKAGLNPALMYGQAGQGGSTGSQGGGSASGGSASGSQAPAIQPMDMQNLMLGAQMNLMKAQARDVNADADIKEGTNPRGEKEIEGIELNNTLTQANIELTEEKKEEVKSQVMKNLSETNINKLVAELDYDEEGGWGKNAVINFKKVASGDLGLGLTASTAVTLATLAVLRNPASIAKYIGRSRPVKGFARKADTMYEKVMKWWKTTK